MTPCASPPPTTTSWAEHRAHRVAVLSQQAPLRWPRCLCPPPQPGARRARAHCRGLLRAALSRARSGSTAHEGPKPRSVSRAGPVPYPRPRRVSRRHRRARAGDDVLGRFSRAAHLQPAGGALAQGSHRRLRCGPRQPDVGLWPAADACGRDAAGLHDPPPDHHRPPDRLCGRSRLEASAQPASVVWIPDHAGPGRPPIAERPDRLALIGARHRGRVRGRPAAGRGNSAGRGPRRIPASYHASRAGTCGGHGQRRYPDEGHRHLVGGLRQASHRKRSRAGAGRQAGPGRFDGVPGRALGHQGLGPIRQRHQRH